MLANLNIAEQRVPQDGRTRLTLDARPVDLRVSTLPTQHGESVVLRVLDKSVVNLDLENLGMPDEVQESTRELITAQWDLCRHGPHWEWKNDDAL